MFNERLFIADSPNCCNDDSTCMVGWLRDMMIKTAIHHRDALYTIGTVVYYRQTIDVL